MPKKKQKRKSKRNGIKSTLPNTERFAPIGSYIPVIQKELDNFVVLYRFMPLAAFEATLNSWALKATLSYEANDPLEMTPSSYFRGGQAMLQLNSPEHDPYPFICFSRIISSPAMWGHYADSGKGVCLAFMLPVGETTSREWTCDKGNKELVEFLDKREDGKPKGFFLKAPGRTSMNESREEIQSSYFLPVRYTQERIPSYRGFMEHHSQNPDAPFHQIFPYLQEWSRTLISTKADSWKYEEELRLICDPAYASDVIGNKMLYQWPMAYLAGVVVGPKCPYSVNVVKRKISLAYAQVKSKHPNYFCSEIKLPFNGDIIVSKATFHWNRFEIEARPWSNRLEGRRFLHAAMLYVYPETVQHINELTGECMDSDLTSWNDYQRAINKGPCKMVWFQNTYSLPDVLREYVRRLGKTYLLIPHTIDSGSSCSSEAQPAVFTSSTVEEKDK